MINIGAIPAVPGSWICCNFIFDNIKPVAISEVWARLSVEGGGDPQESDWAKLLYVPPNSTGNLLRPAWQIPTNWAGSGNTVNVYLDVEFKNAQGDGGKYHPLETWTGYLVMDDAVEIVDVAFGALLPSIEGLAGTFPPTIEPAGIPLLIRPRGKIRTTVTWKNKAGTKLSTKFRLAIKGEYQQAQWQKDGDGEWQQTPEILSGQTSDFTFDTTLPDPVGWNDPWAPPASWGGQWVVGSHVDVRLDNSTNKAPLMWGDYVCEWTDFFLIQNPTLTDLIRVVSVSTAAKGVA